MTEAVHLCSYFVSGATVTDPRGGMKKGDCVAIRKIIVCSSVNVYLEVLVYDTRNGSSLFVARDGPLYNQTLAVRFFWPRDCQHAR